MKELDEIVELVNQARYEAVKHFEKGQALAGKRLRAHLRGIKALCQVIKTKTNPARGVLKP